MPASTPGVAVVDALLRTRSQLLVDDVLLWSTWRSTCDGDAEMQSPPGSLGRRTITLPRL